MKTIRDFLDLNHAHIGRQISIQRRMQFMRREYALHTHARNLGFGMNARIRAPRAVNCAPLSFKHRDGALKFTLHRALFARVLMKLHLPTTKVGSVICEREFVVH